MIRGSVFTSGHAGPHADGLLAFGFITMNGTTPVLKKQHNVRRVQRMAAGVYRFIFETPLPDIWYLPAGGGRWANSASNADFPIPQPSRNSATGFNLWTQYACDIAFCGLTGGPFELDHSAGVYFMRGDQP